jgi:hypothetical protein
VKVRENFVDIFKAAIFEKRNDFEYLIGRSLFIFNDKNKFRMLCYKIVESKLMLIIIFLLIIL